MNFTTSIIGVIVGVLYSISLIRSYQVVKKYTSIKCIIIICNLLIIVSVLRSAYITFLYPEYMLRGLGYVATYSIVMIFFVDGYDTYITLKSSYDAARSVAREYILGIRQSPYSHAPYESECNKSVKRIIELEEATRRADEAEQRAVKAEEQSASCLDGHGLCSVVIQMREEGKTDEEIAKHLKASGLSIPQIGVLLHTNPYVSKSARVKHAQRLLGVS